MWVKKSWSVNHPSASAPPRGTSIQTTHGHPPISEICSCFLVSVVLEERMQWPVARRGGAQARANLRDACMVSVFHGDLDTYTSRACCIHQQQFDKRAHACGGQVSGSEQAGTIDLLRMVTHNDTVASGSLVARIARNCRTQTQAALALEWRSRGDRGRQSVWACAAGDPV